MTDAPKTPPYANSAEAYKAIMETCAWAIEACLVENRVSDAVRCAMMMQMVETLLKRETVEVVRND